MKKKLPIDIMTESCGVTTVRGDIFQKAEDFWNKGELCYIAHQCNCESKIAKGLAKDVFDRFPGADIYRDGSERVMGNVIVKGNIINICAQYNRGRAKIFGIDTDITREQAFSEALEKLPSCLHSTIQSVKILFPWKIGCGYGGGDWEHYKAMIHTFATNHPQFSVFIVQL